MQEEIVNFFLIFSQNAIFSWRYAFSWSMGRRTCSMVSRSRTVTQYDDLADNDEYRNYMIETAHVFDEAGKNIRDRKSVV